MRESVWADLRRSGGGAPCCSFGVVCLPLYRGVVRDALAASTLHDPCVVAAGPINASQSEQRDLLCQSAVSMRAWQVRVALGPGNSNWRGPGVLADDFRQHFACGPDWAVGDVRASHAAALGRQGLERTASESIQLAATM